MHFFVGLVQKLVVRENLVDGHKLCVPGSVERSVGVITPERKDFLRGLVNKNTSHGRLAVYKRSVCHKRGGSHVLEMSGQIGHGRLDGVVSRAAVFNKQRGYACGGFQQKITEWVDHGGGGGVAAYGVRTGRKGR